MSEMGFGYGKIKKLPLTKQHKYRRVFLAKQWISENFINQNVIFSDEKRFSFDGPDSWFYWYDPIDPPSRIKRLMNGGGIMVWGMTFPNGEIHVEKLDGRVDSTKYISLIKYKVKPIINKSFDESSYL